MVGCFLDCQLRQSNHCGALLFRGDYEIGRRRLPRMWAAYGFIMVLISQSHEDENTDLTLSSVFVLGWYFYSHTCRASTLTFQIVV